MIAEPVSGRVFHELRLAFSEFHHRGDVRERGAFS